ncbi:carbohydrate kinase family protein [Bacillus sp. CH_442]|uniref:carbohydrate kinase family protein n=1 Tax=Bacillus sp. CH_442 TaxID=2978217 RepID=UPI0030F6533B|nr:carbohydrate kinase family protein [Bacillus thuringiensis]
MNIKIFGDGCLHLNTKLNDQLEKFKFGEIQISPGGSATNVALQLNKLGLKVDFNGIVGDDPYGELFCKLLKEEDIKINKIIRNGTTHKVLISTNPPQEANVTIDLGNINIDLLKQFTEGIDNGDFVYVPGFDSYHPLLEEISKKNCTIFTDYGHLSLENNTNNYLEGLREVAQFSDIILASGFKFNRELFKVLNPIIKESRCRYLIITYSGEGVLIIDKNGIETYFEMKKEKVCNNIGAGDSFMGAVIYGIYNNWKLERVIDFAHKVASLRIQFFNHIPSLEEIE